MHHLSLGAKSSNELLFFKLSEGENCVRHEGMVLSLGFVSESELECLTLDYIIIII